MPTPPSLEWLVMCTVPDYCTTDGYAIPYFIVSEAKLADLESTNVAYNGLRSLNVTSVMRSCSGNEAGDAGAKSGAPVQNRCEQIDKSDTVLVNGQGAVRELDRFWMNKRNCWGRVFVIPAVSSPGDRGNLDEVQFDISVASLVSAMLEQSGGDVVRAKSVITLIRQSEANPSVVTENPVVVAAQHFLNSVGREPSGAGLLSIWLFEKPLVKKLQYIAKSSPFANKLGVNPKKPTSEADPRVERWAYAGAYYGVARKRGIAKSPLEYKKMGDRLADEMEKRADKIIEGIEGIGEIIEDAGVIRPRGR